MNQKTSIALIALSSLGLVAIGFLFGIQHEPPRELPEVSATEESEPIEETTTSLTELTEEVPAPTGTLHTVSVKQTGFIPAELSVKVGDAILFVNDDTLPHEVAFGGHEHHTLYPGYEEQVLEPGAKVQIILSTPGEYSFHDNLNESSTGTVRISTETGELSLMPSHHHEEMERFMDSDHMRVTPSPAPTAEETKRAVETLAAIKAATAKYADYRVAEKAGYINKNPKPYKAGAANERHFSGTGAAKYNAKALDPTHPNALLYEMQSDGDYRLKGVMFTAPLSADEADLNARYFPLSETIWHKHLNTCKKDGLNVKGATTEASCKSKGGTFRTESSWMTHLYF